MRDRIEEDKKAVGLMIQMYCRHKEHNKELCKECTELLHYAYARLDRCKFGNRKPTCKKCPIHCYGKDMRARIRMIMRWAGPRMVLYHPTIAIRHLYSEIFIRKNKRTDINI